MKRHPAQCARRRGSKASIRINASSVDPNGDGPAGQARRHCKAVGNDIALLLSIANEAGTSSPQFPEAGVEDRLRFNIWVGSLQMVSSP
jgi:hypothetical protein